MAKRPKIALLVESSRGYGRGVLRGIGAYVRTHDAWSIYHQERMLADDAPRWMRGWDGDGIIARLESPKLIRSLRKLDVPIVDVRGMHEIENIPIVDVNEKAVSDLAANHLRERGFEHFAFCGFNGVKYSDRRRDCFVQRLKASGHDVHVFHGRSFTEDAMTPTFEAPGERQWKAIADWLKSLPRPVGVMACNDVRAQQILEVCRDMGVAIPDEIAVIGVDNDLELCQLCDPPLSSIELDTERIGYTAAATLDRLMRGEAPEEAVTLIDPIAAVTRQSTDVLAIADPEIAQAVRYIREHACDGLTVEQVLSHLTLSRSTLERRFNELIGRSPKAEILRVQIDKAKLLLSETDFKLARIAELAGFKHAEYLNSLFKRKVGVTPGQYRSRYRIGE
ncbi:MAG: AraC family transcriptional regulator [Phycisphaera sp.]|nr:AraC family transcriptional regulator [Phycisphaera sp.]